MAPELGAIFLRLDGEMWHVGLPVCQRNRNVVNGHGLLCCGKLPVVSVAEKYPHAVQTENRLIETGFFRPRSSECVLSSLFQVCASILKNMQKRRNPVRTRRIGFPVLSFFVDMMVRLSDTDTNNYDRLFRYKNSLINRDKVQKFPDTLPSDENPPLTIKDKDSNERVVSQLQKKQKKLSKEEIQQLIADYKSGLSVKQLANKYGCYRITVSRKLKAAGVIIRHMPPTDNVIDKMVELYQSGLSLNDVSRQVGRSAKTVKKYIELRGVEIRN